MVYGLPSEPEQSPAEAQDPQKNDENELEDPELQKAIELSKKSSTERQ
jgi:hypothetical protein